MTKTSDNKNQIETTKAVMGHLASMPHQPHIAKKKAKKKPAKKQASASV